LYWHLVDKLHLTIEMMPQITLAQLLDNVTIEDMARLFTGDGITIPKISDAFEWGQMALAGWSTGSKASRQTEAMQAMITACEQTSHNNWDRLVPLEPRWWYPSTGAPEMMVVEPATTTEDADSADGTQAGRALHSPTCIHGVYIDFRWSMGSPNMEFMLMAVYVDSM